MVKPSRHIREEERLTALNYLQLLDSPFEDEFDQITQLAAQICATPIALISLIDQNRQWFKSRVGLDVSETPREYAFCAHTIHGDDLLEVFDSRKDERFVGNPLVEGKPHVIFYAGVPVRDPEKKLPLGTLCVIDHNPRELHESQRHALIVLAKQVNKILELRSHWIKLKYTTEKLSFLNSALSLVSEGYVIQDRRGRVIEINQKASEILGLTEAELRGEQEIDKKWKMVSEQGVPFELKDLPFARAMATGEPQRNILIGVGVEENWRWINVNSTPLFIDGEVTPSHSVTSFSDVTLLRETYSAVVERDRLASLGALATGISHEINNPLAIIGASAAYISKALKRTPIDLEKIDKSLDNIQSTTNRIANIVKSISRLGNEGHEPPSITRLALIVKDIMLVNEEKLTEAKIKFEILFDESILVCCSRSHLSQVFMNLLNNAIEALAKSAEKWIRIDAKKIGDHVQILFRDSGMGISPEIADQIFLPFFTTKPPSSGTGLGLSISKRLMEKMKGDLSLDIRDPNTCFILQVPGEGK